MMILAFIGIVLTIRSLNSGKPITNLFVGMLTTAPSSDSKTRGDDFNLCHTRVTSIETTGRPKVLEEKMKWFREGNDGVREPLDIVEVEKWFAVFCKVKGHKTELEGSPAFELVMRFHYVKGEPQTLMQSVVGGRTVYQWNDQTFVSPMLDTGLLKFSALPSAKTPGTH